MKRRTRALLQLALLGLTYAVVAQAIPSGAPVDDEVRKLMARTGAKGMAVAIVDHGSVAYTQSYGIRNANGDPLTIDTVMYGASLMTACIARRSSACP